MLDQETKPTGTEDYFLLVAGYPSDDTYLVDKDHLYGILEALPREIGMNTIQAPVVLEATNNPGLEGYVPIDESNITISTYTNHFRFVASIHSCSAFHYPAVIDFLSRAFHTEKVSYRYLCESEFAPWMVGQEELAATL